MSNTKAQRARRKKRDNFTKALTLVASRRKRDNLIKALVLIAISVALLLTICIAANTRPTYDFSETETYCVAQGDTLWTIAGQYCDNSRDIRKVIDIIEKINEINPLIYPGDTLEIPIFEDN